MRHFSSKKRQKALKVFSLKHCKTPPIFIKQYRYIRLSCIWASNLFIFLFRKKPLRIGTLKTVMSSTDVKNQLLTQDRNAFSFYTQRNYLIAFYLKKKLLLFPHFQSKNEINHVTILEYDTPDMIQNALFTSFDIPELGGKIFDHGLLYITMTKHPLCLPMKDSNL